MTSLGKVRYLGSKAKIQMKGVEFRRGVWIDIYPYTRVEYITPDELLDNLLVVSESNPHIWGVVDLREPEPEEEPEAEPEVEEEEDETVVEKTTTLFKNLGKEAVETVKEIPEAVRHRFSPKGGD